MIHYKTIVAVKLFFKYAVDFLIIWCFIFTIQSNVFANIVRFSLAESENNKNIDLGAYDEMSFKGKEAILINKEIIFTEKDLDEIVATKISGVSSALSVDEYDIMFKFKSAKSEELRRVTSNNIGRRMAILMNNEVLFAPIIMGEVISGSIAVSGKMSKKDIAKLLKVSEYVSEIDKNVKTVSDVEEQRNQTKKGNAPFYIQEANKYLEKNEFENAIKFLKKAIKISPNIFLYKKLGFCYFMIGENEKSLSIYNKALEIGFIDQVWDIYLIEAKIYQQQGENDIASKKLKKALILLDDWGKKVNNARLKNFIREKRTMVLDELERLETVKGKGGKGG